MNGLNLSRAQAAEGVTEGSETPTTGATKSAGGSFAGLLTTNVRDQVQGVGASILSGDSQRAFGKAQGFASSLLRALSPKSPGEADDAGPSSLPFPATSQLHSIGSHLFQAVSHAASGHSHGALGHITNTFTPNLDAAVTSGGQHTIVEIPEATETALEIPPATPMNNQPPGAAGGLAVEMDEFEETQSGSSDRGSAPTEGAQAGPPEGEPLPNIASSVLGQILSHTSLPPLSTHVGAWEAAGSWVERFHGASQSALARCKPQNIGRMLFGVNLQEAGVSPEGLRGALQERLLQAIRGRSDSPSSLAGSIHQAAAEQAEVIEAHDSLIAAAASGSAQEATAGGSVMEAMHAIGQPVGLGGSLFAAVSGAVQGQATGRRGPLCSALLGAVAKKAQVAQERLSEAQLQPSGGGSDQDLSNAESSSSLAESRAEQAEPSQQSLLEPLLDFRNIAEMGISGRLLQSLLPIGVAVVVLCMLKMVQQVCLLKCHPVKLARQRGILC